MKKIYVTTEPDYSGKVVFGKQKENRVIQLVMNCERFIEMYGSGTPTLVFRRPGETNPYLMHLNKISDTEWDTEITNVETEIPGYGVMELRWSVGEDGLAKSAIYDVQIVKSITDNTIEPPEELKTWYDKMIQYIDTINADNTSEAKQAAEEAKSAADKAKQTSETVSTSADNAKKSEEEATKQAGVAKSEADKATKTLEDLRSEVEAGEFDGIGVASVEQIKKSTTSGGVNVIRVTLTDGTYSDFEVTNGSRGSAGALGIGIQSVTQIKTTSESNGQNTIRVTLTSGQYSDFVVRNGKQGATGQTGPQGPKGNPGEPGEPGKDGYTPVRGTDYWTEEDKATIVSEVENSEPIKAIKEDYSKLGKVIGEDPASEMTAEDIITALKEMTPMLTDMVALLINLPQSESADALLSEMRITTDYLAEILKNMED